MTPSVLELFTVKPPESFFESSRRVEDSKIVVVGFPYDSTSSFRVGSRYAPSAIRRYTCGLEGYCWELDLEVSEIPIADAGDLVVVHGDTAKTLKRLGDVVEELKSMEKVVTTVGGEHTLTLSAFKSCKADGLVVFDAHMDFRDEYPCGQRLSHATWLKRLCESFDPSKVVVVGVRAVCKDELREAKRLGLTFISMKEYRERGLKAFRDAISSMKGSIYVSVDVDVLDPAYAPGVSNPEPLGFTLAELLEHVWALRGLKIAGFDVVEVCPPYDNGCACACASKILLDLACLAWLS